MVFDSGLGLLDSNPRGIDAIDKALIAELRADGRQSLAKLGEVVGLTGDSVRDRLTKLTTDGVLTVTCSVDPRVLGFRSITLIGIKVRGRALDIAESLAEVSEFDFVGCTAGEYDILVEAVCRDELHLLSVVDEHIVLDACDELMLDRPTLDRPSPSIRSRDKRGTKSRG
jgi:Lrp/AsnC family transcriptional regulator for asnA, asnC and gidA